MSRPDITPYLPLVRGKCREVSRHYGGYVEVEDLVQEVALWWYSIDPGFLENYVVDEGKSRLRRSVFRVARDAAEKYRRQVAFDDVFVQVRYSPMEVMKLLPVALDPDGLPDGGGVSDDMPRSHGNLAEGGDVIASLLDVRRAYAALDGEDRTYLTWLDELRWNYETAGEYHGIAADSVRRRVARIAERMAKYLNNEQENDNE